MIIRSQDKKIIVNMDNIDTFCIRENVILAFNGADDMGISIGKYSTEEKAMKVMDMIQEKYGKHYCRQGRYMATEDYNVQPFAFIPPKVFQMPQDEEV